VSRLEGNLLYLYRAIRSRRPDLRVVVLLEPYGYGLRQKVAYFVRVIRGMFELRRARLFVVDNAYLPVHVAAHAPETTVVQVWHAAGALKRFGLDTAAPVEEPEATFLHRYYDYVVTSGEASRSAWSRALRTPPDRVLPLGTPRTDFFFDAAGMVAARARLLARHPQLADRRVVLDAATFRGRGRRKRPGVGLDVPRMRAALPPEFALVLKTHPNLDASLVPTDGYDVVAEAKAPLNELLALTDILVTDYSSAIFEYALLRRPIVLLVGDLDAYEADPGLYIDYRTGMIGTPVTDTDGAIEAILADRFDLSTYEAFIARHLGACDGGASARFVDRFLPDGP